MNWFRAEASLTSRQSPVPLIKLKEPIERINLIINHTRYFIPPSILISTRFVDEIDILVEKYASLKTLWYWKEPLFECFSRSIKDGPNQPLHATTFLRLCASFPSNVTPFNAEEVRFSKLRLNSKA